MTATETSRSAQVRAGLGHPVIDADGHFVELGPLLYDEILSYVEEMAGTEMRERFVRSGYFLIDTSSSVNGRASDPRIREEWRAMPSWWGWRTRNTLDRATSHLPRLLYDRLEEFGIDFALLYPSMANSSTDRVPGEIAGVLSRAVNRATARAFGPYADRMTAGGLVPMHTPEIAVAELEYAVQELGLKTLVVSGYAIRPLGPARDDPTLGSLSYRLDTFGIDSEFDYDPFWARCVELGVAPVSHSALQYHRVTRSISNYQFNHISGMSSCHEALCKSMFLGGVTKRFPALRVGFLEGGVAWGCSLLADLVGHWEKRNGKMIGDLDPANLDVDGLVELLDRYGDDDVRSNLPRLREYFSRRTDAPAQLDEFEAVGADSVDELVSRFVPNFYFGCEADDPLVAWAFDGRINPGHARLRPMFGSDISHWDVVEMNETVEEAYEAVEHGVMDEEAFSEFCFLNPVRLHAGANPKFFDGTVLEGAVRALGDEIRS